MSNIIKIKNRSKNDLLVDVELVTLLENDLDDMLKFQDKIISCLDNKEIYVSNSKEDFLKYFKMDSYFLGVRTLESNKLIALGIYINKKLAKENYGYDLDYKEEDILKTGQIDTTIVDPSFRGNKLQKLLCEKLEDVAKERGDKYLTATVSPINPYSLNTFLNLGYKNKKEKLKYGGLKRCILEKPLIRNNN